MGHLIGVSILLLSVLACCICEDYGRDLRTNRINDGKNVVRFVKDFMRVRQQVEDEHNLLDSRVLSSLNSTETESKFIQFIEEHKYHIYRRASPREYELRKAIFERNLLKIDLLNHLEQGTAVYDVNEFSDLDDREFIRSKLGYKQSLKKERLLNKLANNSTDNEMDFETLWKGLLVEEGKTEQELFLDAPESFDWRKKHGVVSSVKNQGMCGSCWAFSTTGNIEGQLKIKKNVTVSLSEEELVDCDTVDAGCNGGLPQQAFDAVIRLGGLETEDDYPYNPKSSKNGCKMVKKAKKYSITSYTNLPHDEEKLKVWLYKRGPIAIGVNASAMQWYRKGISHPLKFFCNPSQLDHAVLLVGYGVEQSKKGPKPYWLIKNSWGTQWGENGYYRLFRGKNVCGVAEDCSTAIINQ